MNTKIQSSAAYQDNVFPISPSGTTSSSQSQVRVRVNQPNSAWVLELNDRFDELTSLPLGWDGYAGQPVSFTCAQFAANLIERLFVNGVSAPQLVPGSDGTLQIEWHQNQYDIEIDVLAPYHIVATRYDHLEDADLEFELQSDFTHLAEWIEDLTKDRSANQLREA